MTGETSAVTDECMDSKGNPTVYAVTELSGAQIVGMLEDNDWAWEEDNLWFVSSDRNDAFYVMGANDYEYTYDEIAGLGANSAGEATCFVIVVDDRDYSGIEDCLSKLPPMVVDDVQWIDDDLGMARVYGPSMEENIVLISYKDDPGLYYIDVFNQEAIESGLIDEWLGDNYGRSVDEIWDSIFG